MSTTKHPKLKTAKRKRVSTLAQDIGLVVVSSILSALTGFAAARDMRGAVIGATGGAALPLAYRAVLTADPSRRLGYGVVALAAVSVSAYLSYTRGTVGGVTPAQIAASAPPQTLQPSTQPTAAPTAGFSGISGVGAFGAGVHG